MLKNIKASVTLKKYRATFTQFIKFGSIGILNTGITLITIYLLMSYTKIDYRIANFIGYVVGLINSFTLNRLWTFKSTGNILKETLFFLLIFAIVFPIELLSLILFKDILILLIPDYFAGDEKFAEKIAQLPAAAIYTVLGFIGNKFLTFSKKSINLNK